VFACVWKDFYFVHFLACLVLEYALPVFDRWLYLNRAYRKSLFPRSYHPISSIDAKLPTRPKPFLKCRYALLGTFSLGGVHAVLWIQYPASWWYVVESTCPHIVQGCGSVTSGLRFIQHWWCRMNAAWDISRNKRSWARCLCLEAAQRNKPSFVDTLCRPAGKLTWVRALVRQSRLDWGPRVMVEKYQPMFSLSSSKREGKKERWRRRQIDGGDEVHVQGLCWTRKITKRESALWRSMRTVHYIRNLWWVPILRPIRPCGRDNTLDYG
jgi:hypothetical protein